MSTPNPLYAHTLVIGKLYPPHAGHMHLIDTALAHTLAAGRGHLTLIVCHRAQEHPSGPVRHAWLASLLAPDITAGRVRLMLVEDTYDQDDSELWAKLTLGWLKDLDHGRERRPLEAVFTSEAYGDPYTKFLTQLSGQPVMHHCVDKDRGTHPVSGTLVRTSPLSKALWAPGAALIPDPVLAFYIPRIVLVGAESTGKSTLTAWLAQAFNTLGVEEVGRQVTEAKLDQEGKASVDGASAPTAAWASADFVAIARAQIDAEEAAAHQLGARHARRALICDTDALATIVWHERYMMLAPDGSQVTKPPSPDTLAAVRSLNHILASANSLRHSVVYLIPDVRHVPFVQDGTRDGEHVREWMHARFLTELRARGHEHYVLDEKEYTEREKQAKAVVQRVLERFGGWDL